MFELADVLLLYTVHIKHNLLCNQTVKHSIEIMSTHCQAISLIFILVLC